MILYQLQINIKPIIHQASYLLSISEHYPDHHSKSILFSIHFRAISPKMFTLYYHKLHLIFDPFYSKHEDIDPTDNQRYEQKLLVYSLAIELKEFKEQWYQRDKQQE